MVRPLLNPDPMWTIFNTPDGQRESMVRAMVADPVAAGEIEFAAWRFDMMFDRDGQCPNGQAHHFEFFHGCRNGYYMRCFSCDHHSDVPF